MRNLCTVFLAVLLVCVLGCGTSVVQNPVNFVVRDQDSSKLSIVFIVDNSTSMDSNLGGTRKLDLAKTSLQNVFNLLDKQNQEKNNIEVSIFAFTAFSSPVKLQQICDFNLQQLSSILKDIDTKGGTPLGSTLAEAQLELDARANGRRYVIFLTDGENSVGSEPAGILESINKFNEQHSNHNTNVLVIAFNTDPRIFDSMKANGAQVFEAQDGEALTKVLTVETEKILELPE